MKKPPLTVKFPGTSSVARLLLNLPKLEQNGIIRIIDDCLKGCKRKCSDHRSKGKGRENRGCIQCISRAVSDAEWFSVDDLEANAKGLPDNRSAEVLKYLVGKIRKPNGV